MREFSSQILCKLSQVQLANDNLLEFTKNLIRVLRKRIDKVEMSQAHVVSFFSQFSNYRVQVTVSSTPSNNEKIPTILVPENLLLRNAVSNLSHLRITQISHNLMVFRNVTNFSCYIYLLQSTDTMFQTFRSR